MCHTVVCMPEEHLLKLLWQASEPDFISKGCTAGFEW